MTAWWGTGGSRCRAGSASAWLARALITNPDLVLDDATGRRLPVEEEIHGSLPG